MSEFASGRLAVDPGRAARPLALAVDVGSSSMRASVWDASGRLVRGTDVRVAYAWPVGPGGAVRQPAAALDRLVDSLLDALVARAGSVLASVERAGLSCFFHSLVGLDRRGRPVTDVLSWADTTAAAAATALAEATDASEAWRRTGAPIHAGYWPARLWQARSDPGSRRAVRWAGYPELVLERLTGVRAMGLSMAGGTGLLNRSSGSWDTRLLAVLGVSAEELPSLAADAEPLGTLSRQTRRRWPALARLQWFPAWGDGGCGNVGLRCVGADRTALMVGTSGAMRRVLDDPARSVPAGLFAYRFGAGHLIVGGQLSEGGGTLAWLAGVTGRSIRGLDREAAATPGPSPVVALPFLMGERGPGYHPNAAGVLAGLGAITDAAGLYRALVDAIAIRFGSLDRLLAAVEPSPGGAEVIVSGGAAAGSRIWPQALADVLGRPINLARTAEASSRGAALLAIHGEAALGPDLAVAAVPSRPVEPDADRHARYREAAALQERLYGMLVG